MKNKNVQSVNKSEENIQDKETVKINNKDKVFIKSLNFSGLINEFEKTDRKKQPKTEYEEKLLLCIRDRLQELNKKVLPQLYIKARKNYNFKKENTGYWFLYFDSSIKLDDFFLLIAKEARTNQKILNVYVTYKKNYLETDLMRIYCTEKNAINVKEIIIKLGFTDSFNFRFSRRCRKNNLEISK